MQMKAHLLKTVFAEAAHRNEKGGDRQRRLHGHSYRVELLAEGPLVEGLGWVVDYGDLKRLFGPALELLDHGYVNELPGMGEDTTARGVEQWILSQLSEEPPWLAGVRVSILGDLAYCPVRLPACEREGVPERIRFRFEAAQSLPQLPEGHPCRKLHGHSYQIEVGAGDLDDLERHLAALYEILDHRYLNEVEGLDHATCERIARWVWRWLEARGAGTNVVIVQETPGARCLYVGE